MEQATPKKLPATVKKAAPAKQAAPVKQAAPAKKAPTKRSPAKKADSTSTAPIEPTAEPPATPEAPPLHLAKPPTTDAEKTPPTADVPETPVAATVKETPAAMDATPATTDAMEVRPRLRVVATESDRRGFDSIAEQVLAEPARTPEILAHALVQALGPRARGWTAHIRATYPTASREALARLAVHRFTRTAGLRGGVGALAGPYAPVAIGTATVITHAELVLHLAAVYGLDPTDPQRAGDLLRLVSPGAGTVAGWAALALTGPVVRLPTAVLSARTTTEAIAVRARRYYTESQLSQESGSS